MFYEREFRIMKSTLIVSKKHDVSDDIIGKILQKKGLISKKSGKITKKGLNSLKFL